MRRKQADSYGFTAEDARCILEGRRAELTPREIDKLITAAIEKALERRTSEQAHLSKHDLVQDVCIATVIHGIDPETIRARVERMLGEGNFISLGRHREHKRYATTQMYRAVEAKALEVAERLGGRYGHVVSEPRVEKAIAKEPR